MNSSPTPILCKSSNPILRIVIAGIMAVAALGIQAQADVPKLFWGSDPINAGETAMLFGDGIGTNVTAMGWRVEDTSVTAPPAAIHTWAPPEGGKHLEVLQTSDKCAKVVLPKEFAPGMYAVRLKGEGGVSAP